MIEQVEVRGFQSLRNVKLDLGPLTVIVGASSSGKTALMRALRAVASNVRGNGVITRGQDAAAITVRLGNGEQITLEYARGAWLYRLVDPAGQERTYTKLNGRVPEDVTAALRIQPVPVAGTSINYAGQFDPPYLLAESGSTIARQLGELTNVTTLFEAAREGIRRRNAYAATLKTREADFDQVTARAAAFTGLPAKLDIVDRAETHLAAVTRLHAQVERLAHARSSLRLCESAVADIPTVDIPGTAALDEVYARYSRLRTTVKEWAQAHVEVAAAGQVTQNWEARIAELHEELHGILLTAGKCPTCHQDVT